MDIRAYDKTDEHAVAALWRNVFHDSPPWNDPASDIRRKLCVQRDLFLVAVDNGEVVGTAMAGYDGHRGWVHYVAVRPDHRRRGIGAALMGEAESRLAEMGCPKLNLQVRASNTRVVAFYERLGYAVEDRVSMAKRLTDDRNRE